MIQVTPLRACPVAPTLRKGLSIANHLVQELAQANEPIPFCPPALDLETSDLFPTASALPPLPELLRPAPRTSASRPLAPTWSRAGRTSLTSPARALAAPDHLVCESGGFNFAGSWQLGGCWQVDSRHRSGPDARGAPGSRHVDAG